MLEKTFRITPNPINQMTLFNETDPTNDIDLKYIKKQFIKNPKYKKFIISREYKDINDKFTLHYHGYFQTVYAKTSIRGHLKKICKKVYKGNEYLSVSQKETFTDYARNYICKDDDIVMYCGYSKKEIQQFIKDGKEYKVKKKLYKMTWMQRVWYYLEEKGYKDKLLSKFVKQRIFTIEKNILPIIFTISEELEINPPPPHIYQQVRISVLRVLFPKAFRQWYTTYIEDSLKYKGSAFLINRNFSESYSDPESESDELEPKIIEI